MFSSDLLQDFPRLLRHLCRTDTLFTKVHPLHEVSETCSEDKEAQTVLSTKAFHQKMLKHCSENDFMNLLYFYLDYYR